jgi:asparagine synthase (glutamine-hydrolysing)
LVFRYVILLWDEQLAGLAARAQALAERLHAKSTQWREVINTNGLRVLVAGATPPFDACVLLGEADRGPVGAVLGEIYRRNAPQSPALLARREAAQIQVTQGRILASAYWGNYVALIEDTNSRSRFVFNDPCGTLPCYFAKHLGVQVVFSCVGDSQVMGLPLSVNSDFVRARAVNGFLDFDIPSLLGVSSVHRGECVEFNREAECVSRAVYWHPASFERARELILEPELAAQALRDTVGDCVNSMAASHSRVVAQVSGGLDSSIVLGCLAQAPNKPDITCYTDYVRESVCDERRWARYATQRKNLRHVEIGRQPESLKYRELPALAASMEPASYFPHWLRGPLNRSLAKEYGATALFTGEGGDSCLCSTSYVFAVNHALRRYGFGRRALRTAAMVARRRDRTIWGVLVKAVGGELFGVGTGGYRRQLATVCRLVSSDVRGALETESRASSSWLAARGPVTQESLLRLGTLAFPPSFYDLSTQPEVEAPVSLSPLCTQPVFEVCMRIPVDVHFDGGRVRGLARRAFADLLPEPIFRRQWKDRPLSMAQGVIQCNLKFVRETLMEGYLMRENILDRGAVELALQSSPTESAALSGEVLSHVDLELWIRNFA